MSMCMYCMYLYSLFVFVCIWYVLKKYLVCMKKKCHMFMVFLICIHRYWYVLGNINLY